MIELVFPTAEDMARPESLEPLKQILQQSIAAGETRSFDDRQLDKLRPKPMPLKQAAQVGQLMVDHPEAFPLQADSSELPPHLARLLKGSSLPPHVPTLTVGFCGGGGDAAGAMLAGMEIKCLFDIDTEAVNYVAEFSACPKDQVYGNFDDLPYEDLPVTDGLSVGTPCPPYSALGSHRGPLDKRDRFLAVVDFIVYRASIGKPYLFVSLEMVPGMHISPQGRRVHAEAVSKLTAAGYDLGHTDIHLANGSSQRLWFNEVSAWEHGLVVNKIRHFTRGVWSKGPYSLGDVIPTRSNSDPTSMGELMTPDADVAAHLFAPVSKQFYPCNPSFTAHPSKPRIVARSSDGVGQPSDPSRVQHHSAVSLLCLASGNVSYTLTPDGNIRQSTADEVAMYHGFGKNFANKFPRETRLKFFGNCICPPVARAVFMSFLRKDVLISVPSGPVVNPVSPFIDITLARRLFPSPVKDCILPPHSLGSTSAILHADTTSINTTAAVEPRVASGIHSVAVDPSLNHKAGQVPVDSMNHAAPSNSGTESIIKVMTVESAKEDNLNSGWPVGSTPYAESLQYQRSLLSVSPRVPRPLSQMFIDPKDSDAGEKFLTAVKAGPPPLSSKQIHWVVYDGPEGARGRVLPIATHHFRTTVDNAILPSFVKLVQRPESSWTQSWQFLIRQLNELRVSWRDWALSLNNPYANDSIVLEVPRATNGNPLGTTLDSKRISPSRFVQHITTRPSTYWDSPDPKECPDLTVFRSTPKNKL